MADIYTEADYFFQLDDEGKSNKTVLRVQVMEKELYIQKFKEIKAAKKRNEKLQNAQQNDAAIQEGDLNTTTTGLVDQNIQTQKKRKKKKKRRADKCTETHH